MCTLETPRSNKRVPKRNYYNEAVNVIGPWDHAFCIRIMITNIPLVMLS